MLKRLVAWCVLPMILLLTQEGMGITRSVKFGYPNEGATWEKGKTYTIEFTTENCAASGAYAGFGVVFFDGTPNSLGFGHVPIETDGLHTVDWTVPEYFWAGDKIWLSVTIHPYGYPVEDLCDQQINIIDPLPSHIQVTNPSAYGIKWAQGSTQTITWTTSGNPISNVRIELQRGQTYQHLSDNAPNTGTFTWHIPADQEVRSDCMIAVTSVSDNRIYDYSDSPFAIVPPGQESIITVDGYKDGFYTRLTDPSDGYLRIPSCAYNDNGRPGDNADLSAEIWTAWDGD
jgi:hypothetical protein